MLYPSGEFTINNAPEPSGVTLVLHGYWQNVDYMYPIATHIASVLPDNKVILLNGFLKEEFLPNSYKWFEDKVWNINDWHKVYDEAVLSMEGYITRLIETHSLKPSDITLVGFSQGAVMALQCGLMLGVKRIVSIAGMLLDEKVLDGRKQESEILIVQNGIDQVVPMQAFESLKDNFTKYCYTFDYRIIPGVGHAIMPSTIEIVSGFLSK